jgi:hypothetical protein
MYHVNSDAQSKAPEISIDQAEKEKEDMTDRDTQYLAAAAAAAATMENRRFADCFLFLQFDSPGGKESRVS